MAKITVVYGDKEEFTLFDVLRETMVIVDSGANQFCRLRPDDLVDHGELVVDDMTIQYVIFAIEGEVCTEERHIETIIKQCVQSHGLYVDTCIDGIKYEIMCNWVGNDEL